MKKNYSSKKLRLRDKTQRQNYLACGFALVMLAVFPLMIGIKGYLNITQCKYTCFVALTVCYLAGVLLAALCSGVKDWKKRLPKPSLPQILLFAYTVWGVICALVSPYEGLWEGQSRYEGVLSMLLYTAIFLGVSLWGTYSERYVPAMAVMAAIQGAIGLVQIFNSSLLYPTGYKMLNSQFVAMMGNCDCMGGLTATVMPALICGYILWENRWRYVMLSAGAALLAIEMHTHVDSATLGLLAALVIALPFVLTRRETCARFLSAMAAMAAVFAVCRIVDIPLYNEFYVKLIPDKIGILCFPVAALLAAGALFLQKKELPWPAKKTVRTVVILAEIILPLVCCVYLYFNPGERSITQGISEILHGNLSDSAGSYRGFVWKACLVLMAQAPIFGCGPGAFYEAFYPYNRLDLVDRVFDFAHNDFLQVGVCTGYIGLALYVAFVAALLVRGIRSADRRPEAIIFLSASVGYLAHSFFSFSIAIVTPIFWVLAAILESFAREENKVLQN